MKRDDGGDIVAFERGDVVWGIDPFKQDPFSDDQPQGDDDGVAPRPWLVISTEAVPFHPEQYLCVTLTTRTWHEDSIPLTETSWEEGGAPEETSIMPWSVSAIQHEFLDTTGELMVRLGAIPDDEIPENGYQGQLKPDLVNAVTRQLIEYLDDSLAD